MNSQISSLRRAAVGLLLLALLLPACATLELPQATGTPQLVVTAGSGDPYPLPSPTFIPPTPYPPPPTQEALPTSTPTATPWPALALPALKGYTLPGPFSGMKILYINEELGGFRLVELDGTNEIVWDALEPFTPHLFQVSPDGTKALFVLGSSKDPKAYSIWVINSDGSDVRALVDPGPADNWYPRAAMWSPDGRQIAYLKIIYDENSVSMDTVSIELWVMDADGSGQRLVLSDTNINILNLYGADPLVFDWMLNGYIYMATRYQLYAVNPNDGSYFRLMDNADPLDLMFSLCPDGQHAANSSELTATRLQAAGFSAQNVPGTIATWSTDGSLLVYQYDQGTWLRDVVTGEDRLLLPGAGFYTARILTISPGNQYLIYQTDAGLFTLDLTRPDSQPSLVLSDPPDAVREHWNLDFVAWIPVP